MSAEVEFRYRSSQAQTGRKVEVGWGEEGVWEGEDVSSSVLCCSSDLNRRPLPRRLPTPEAQSFPSITLLIQST